MTPGYRCNTTDERTTHYSGHSKGAGQMGKRVFAAVLVSALALPATAYAQDAAGQETVMQIVFGIATLAAALFLLFTAYSLEHVAEGSAMAENIRWVVLSALCLCVSVVLNLIARYMPDITSAAVTRMGADALTVIAVVFMCVYFYRVRSAMTQFLKAAKSAGQSLTASEPPVEATLSDQGPASPTEGTDAEEGTGD
jgi:hypothetical protein